MKYEDIYKLRLNQTVFTISSSLPPLIEKAYVNGIYNEGPDKCTVSILGKVINIDKIFLSRKDALLAIKETIENYIKLLSNYKQDLIMIEDSISLCED